MGRLFTKAGSQYAEVAATVPVEPVTLSCWYYATDFATSPNCLAISSGVTAGIKLGFTTSGAAQIVCTNSAGTNGIKNTTTTTSAGVWAHALAVCATASSRDVYLNKLGLASDTTNIVQSGLDRYLINTRYSSSSRGLFGNGIYGEQAIWNAALSSQEINALADGVSALNIRPQNLVFCVPMFGVNDPEINLVGDPLPLFAGPTTSNEHPKVYREGRSVANVI